MEYALEGYGYAAARVLRGMLKHRQNQGGEPSYERGEHLLEMLEGGLAMRSEELVQMFSRLVLGDDAPELEPPPELLSSLRPLGHCGPVNGLALRVASATKEAFDVFQQAMELRITACSIEQDDRGGEHLLLGMHAPGMTADIRLDDSVAAGVLVALRGEPEGGRCRLEVLPRLYRKICQNGTIVFAGEARSHELDPKRFLGSEAVEPLARALERTIRACFDAKVFESAVDSFRRSANDPLRDRDLADALVGGLSPRVREAVLQRYSSERDFTRWGLLNAVTAEARTAPSGLLLHLERLGGELARQSVAMAGYVPSKPSLPSSKKLSAA